MSLNVKNQRVLLKQLENDISKILNEKSVTDDMDVIASIREAMSRRIPNVFDRDKFRIQMDLNNGALLITPLNFITALWLQGIAVDEGDITSDTYETQVAVFQWEDESLKITPKVRADLF